MLYCFFMVLRDVGLFTCINSASVTLLCFYYFVFIYMYQNSFCYICVFLLFTCINTASLTVFYFYYFVFIYMCLYCSFCWLYFYWWLHNICQYSLCYLFMLSLKSTYMLLVTWLFFTVTLRRLVLHNRLPVHISYSPCQVPCLSIDGVVFYHKARVL